jgi:hypothetical protein
MAAPNLTARCRCAGILRSECNPRRVFFRSRVGLHTPNSNGWFKSTTRVTVGVSFRRRIIFSCRPSSRYPFAGTLGTSSRGGYVATGLPCWFSAPHHSRHAGTDHHGTGREVALGAGAQADTLSVCCIKAIQPCWI